MRRKDIIKFITNLVKRNSENFNRYSKRLEDVLNKISLENVKINILECGVLPESFRHDSTEEKLYSKYSDILLAKTLNLMGIKSKVVKERADAPDVEGRSKDYSIVADAKVFRLSRTAKNQKDFKVEALSKWKKDKDFACMVCPLYQYPKSKSQIYRQAIDNNVTLLSYIHLYFVLSQKEPNKFNYKPLWMVGKNLKGAKDAKIYWNAIEKTICKVLNKDQKELNKIKQFELQLLKKVATDEIGYIKDRIQSFGKIPKQKFVETLIKAEKLNSKIKQIQKISGLK